jgi:anti-sigma B factor antagonist
MEPLLRVHTSVLDDVAVVRMSGELDLTGADALLTSLEPAVELAGRAVVVDLREVTFVDCAGLSALVDARTAISQRGIELVLAAPSRPVGRLLSLTGSGRQVQVFRTVRQAVNRYRVSTTTARMLPRPPRAKRGGLRRPVPVVPLPDGGDQDR